MATLNTRTYNQDAVGENTVRYTGPAHTFSTNDVMQASRVYPKAGRNGDLGVARPEMKLTKSVVVNTVSGERKDAIVRISGSLPVGMTAADIEAMLADVAAFAASTDGKDLFKKLDIHL
jgi:hypothetical protein